MTDIRFDPDGVFSTGTGITRRDFEAWHDRLAAVRQELVEADVERSASAASHDEPASGDAAVLALPERMLSDYRGSRETSDLGRGLKVARRLQETVDRVVVLGIGGSALMVKAFLEACCQPYFNELTRGERGAKPRLYVESNLYDNDAINGLLHLLGQGRTARGLHDRWALLILQQENQTIETSVVLPVFLDALKVALGGEPLQEFVIPVTRTRSELAAIAQRLGCREIFSVPAEIEERYSVFSSAGLLPASIVGLNVVALLEGAADMSRHFRSAPPGNNVVLDYANLCHLAKRRGYCVRVLSVWAKALESVGYWYDQLLAESLGADPQGPTSLTLVNPRALHTHGRAYLEGSRDRLFMHLHVDQWRTDPVRIVPRVLDASECEADIPRDVRKSPDAPRDFMTCTDLPNGTLPDIMKGAIGRTRQALRDAGRPTVDIQLPGTDERSLGQLLQMLMLATIVECRLQNTPSDE